MDDGTGRQQPTGLEAPPLFAGAGTNGDSGAAVGPFLPRVPQPAFVMTGFSAVAAWWFPTSGASHLAAS